MEEQQRNGYYVLYIVHCNVIIQYKLTKCTIYKLIF